MSPRFTLTARSPSGLRVTDIVRDVPPAEFIVAMLSASDDYRTEWVHLVVEMDGNVVVDLVCVDRSGGGALTWRTEPVKAGA